MVVVGGADETVIGDVHQLPQVKDTALTQHDVVHVLLRGTAGLFCLVLDFLTVLVGAGEEANIIALQPLIASHCIGCHGAVGVANVQLGRGVVDGGCDIVITLRHKNSSCKN